MAERLTAADFEAKVLKNAQPALIDFYSDSCVPCKKMSPVLADIEETYQGKLYVGKVNIAYEANLVQTYGVMSAPTLLLFKNGEVQEKLTGAKKKAELEEVIRKYI